MNSIGIVLIKRRNVNNTIVITLPSDLYSGMLDSIELKITNVHMPSTTHHTIRITTVIAMNLIWRSDEPKAPDIAVNPISAAHTIVEKKLIQVVQII